MRFIKLFLTLFNFIFFFFTNRKRLKHVLLMHTITIKALIRILNQKGIRVRFEPHEKYIIASIFEGTEEAHKYFSFVSPKTILKYWKNAIAKHWSYPHKTPGRPPLSTTVKKLILKLKKENFLWGARRIRDELRKLSIEVSHETICKVIQRFRKTGDIKAWFNSATIRKQKFPTYYIIYPT